MKNIGDYINEYRILWAHSSSMLYECYIVERATDPGTSYVLQTWKTVRLASNQSYLRFLSQMGRLKALRQPPILAIEDFGVDTDDHPYVLLPYETAHMERLSERLQRGTLNEEEAENILTTVSAALVLAHQHDLIHGFFSPESVLLTPGNEVRVTAFLYSDPNLSNARSSLPTQYRFPESSASRLSDQYALAGLVQNLLLEQGEPPEDAASIRQTIARAQALEPTQRFESIREFLGEIGYLLDLPENEKELETPPSYSASQRSASTGTAQSRGAPPAQRRHVIWSRLAVHKQASGRRFWINLITASMLTLAMVIAFMHYLGSWEYAASNNQPLEIVGSCGENITIDLHAGGSVNGLWASNDGLWLTLQGVTRSVAVVPSRPETWGDEISTSNLVGDDPLIVSGTFALPCPPGKASGQVLNGHITGDVLYPASLEDSVFEDQDLTIDIPVRVHVVGGMTWLWESGALVFWMLAGLESMLLLVILDLLFCIITRRRGNTLPGRVFGETHEDRIISLKGLISGLLPIALMAGVLLLLIKVGLPSSAEVQSCVQGCLYLLMIYALAQLLVFVIRRIRRIRR